MAVHDSLKSLVRQYIKTNGQNEITGQILQNVLIAMIDELGGENGYAGVATPSTNPGAPDGKVFYFATEAGTYTHFDGATLTKGIHLLVFSGVTWSHQTLYTIDSEVTSGSNNLITSGAVYTKIINAINALDATVSKSAGADGLSLSLTEVGGKVTNISGSIAPQTYDAYGASSAAQIAAATDATNKVNAAKTQILGDAASDYNTLGKLEDKIQAEASRAEAAEGALDNAKANKATTLAGYGINDAYTKTEVNGLVSTPHQNYVTVPTYASLPATGSADTIYRVSNYNGSTSQVDASVYSEYAWNGSGYTFLRVDSQIGEVFDITVYNSNTKYADLAAALGTNGANVPSSIRRGGMSVKFVQSSDNKYVQYRCFADEFTTDTNKWAICDGGVYIKNPEWDIVKTDKKNRILYGVKSDGKFYFGEGCPQQVKEYVEERINTLDDLFVTKVTGKSLIDEIFASTQSVVENPEYLEVKKDSKNRIIEAIRKDGKKELGLPTDQDDILQKQIDVINNNLAVNNIENKEIITLAFISKATNHDEVVDNIKNGEWGLWYGNAGQELIYKTINGSIYVIDDTATLCSYKYNYAGTIFSIFQAQGYVMPQLCEDVKKPSHDVLPDCKIPMLDIMPDYTGESWDWTKAVREWSRGAAVYSIMQQSYAYLDALVLAYPNLITKYDPMASADYTEGGITVHAMPNIKTYMSNHGFNAYPFWYDGCDEGDYTVGEYTAHIKACPAFRTFVYKISQVDNWYMYKQDNRRVRRRNLYVQAGVHGYENMGPVAACHLAKELVSTSDSAFSVLAHFDVYILPCLDGYNILHGDYNGALGVNANRNYPTPWWREEDEHWGKAAGDYFVTRLACAFIDTLNPDVAFDVHDQTPAVRDFGYFECGYHYTTHQMYHAYPCIASVVRNTSDFVQYFGTKNQIPLMRNQDFPTNAAHAHDYFFAKGIRCGGVLELPSGINYTAQSDGTCVYGRVTANDFNQDTWELAGLLIIDYVYKMCEYNINNF